MATLTDMNNILSQDVEPSTMQSVDTNGVSSQPSVHSNIEQLNETDNTLIQELSAEAQLILSRKRSHSLSACSEYDVDTPSKMIKGNGGDALPALKAKGRRPKPQPRNSPATSNKASPKLNLYSLQAEMRSLAASTDQKMETKFDAMLTKITLTVKDTMHDEIANLTQKFDADVALINNRMDALTVELHGVAEGLTRDVCDINEQTQKLRIDIDKCSTKINAEVSKHGKKFDKKIDSLSERVKELEDTGSCITELEGKYNNLLQKMNESTNATPDETVQTLVQRVEHLENNPAQGNNITDIVVQHQKYLEHLESSKRAQNLVIYGIPENQMEIQTHPDGEIVACDDDDSKVCNILKFLDKDTITIDTMKRLGKPPEDNTGKPRPVLIGLNSTATEKWACRVPENIYKKGHASSSATGI